MMDHRIFRRSALLLAFIGALALVSAAGCQNRGKVQAPKVVVPPTGVVDTPIAPTAVETLASTFDKAPPNPVKKRPLNALVISAGGQYAAFDAGLLIGWTASGTRPVFDSVTGVSSGALVAIFSYLGPKYDPRLQYYFTTLEDKAIFQYQPIRQLVRNSSVANSARMKKLLDDEINECMLMDIRDAHAEGRRLYVATMNLKTRRPCIWDLGAIATSGRPDAGDLVRKVMLAAVAIPGLLPSVPFDYEVDGCRFKEEHVDGGAATQSFLRLGPGSEKPANGEAGWLKGSNLYAMAAGKLYPPLLPDDPGFVRRITSTLSAALYALYRSELMGMYAFSASSGMTFHMIAIPEDADVPPNSTTFDPVAMKKLFARGYDTAKVAIPWRLTPPGAEPGEEERPRDTTGILRSTR